MDDLSYLNNKKNWTYFIEDAYTVSQISYTK